MARPRTVWLATGIAWGVSAAIFLANPTSLDLVTVLDWAGLLAYTVAWLLFAPAIVLATRLVPSRSARFVGLAVAIAAAVTGLANLAEAGLRIEAANAWYTSGILVATILLVPLSYLFARDRSNPLALLAILLFLGIGFTSNGFGGLLVLVAFGALALRTSWFEPRPPAALSEVELLAAQ